ncbi:hypothetical protein D3C77_309500 [compost metagenome]
MNHDDRRVRPAQVGVAQLDPAAVDHRWLVLADCVFEDLRQAAGWPAGNRRLERVLNRLVQVAHASAMQRRDEVNVGEVYEEQPALKLGLHVVALARLHAVPLVQGDDNGATGFQGKAKQVQVMVNHTFAGVHDEDHHVGVLDRLQGFHHRELFDFLVDLAALAHTSGVDQRVLLFVTLEGNVDTVAGSTRLVIDDHPVFTEHAVDQGRLANVRPADDGDLDAIFFARARDTHRFLAFGDVGVDLFLFLVARELAQHRFKQVVDATALGTGDANGVAHAQWRELGDGHLRIDVVDLVGHQERALVALAQVLGNHLVSGSQAGTRVHQEQHHIGFFDGQQRLLGHFFVHAMLVTGNTTGVDQDVRTALPARFTVLAVSGQPGQVADDSVAGPGQAVEHGGFTDVRSAHQGDYGNHAALHFINSKNTKAAALQRPEFGRHPKCRSPRPARPQA